MLAALALAFLVLYEGQGLRQPGTTCALLLALPVAWCAVAGTTAWVLGAPDWWLLPAAGLLVCGLSGWRAGRATDRPGLA
jgi:hypothetical protein